MIKIVASLLDWVGKLLTSCKLTELGQWECKMRMYDEERKREVICTSAYVLIDILLMLVHGEKFVHFILI